MFKPTKRIAIPLSEIMIIWWVWVVGYIASYSDNTATTTVPLLVATRNPEARSKTASCGMKITLSD
jgi:hypothetical protein